MHAVYKIIRERGEKRRRRRRRKGNNRLSWPAPVDRPRNGCTYSTIATYLHTLYTTVSSHSESPANSPSHGHTSTYTKPTIPCGAFDRSIPLPLSLAAIFFSFFLFPPSLPSSCSHSPSIQQSRTLVYISSTGETAPLRAFTISSLPPLFRTRQPAVVPFA